MLLGCVLHCHLQAKFLAACKLTTQRFHLCSCQKERLDRNLIWKNPTFQNPILIQLLHVQKDFAPLRKDFVAKIAGFSSAETIYSQEDLKDLCRKEILPWKETSHRHRIFLFFLVPDRSVFFFFFPFWTPASPEDSGAEKPVMALTSKGKRVITWL